MWFVTSTKTCRKTNANHTPSRNGQVIRPQPHLGELVGLSLVFPESQEVVLIAPVRELSETCVEEDAGSVPPRSIEDGIDA